MKHSRQAAKVIAALLVTASAASISVGAAQVGTAATGSLRLRETAAAASAAATTVADTGSAASAASQQTNGQYTVVYQSQTGDVSSADISYDQDSTGSYACVNTGGSTLRIRSGPGTTYTILGSVANGTTLPLTGTTDGWYQVSYNGRTGYISLDFAQVKTADQVKNGASGGTASDAAAETPADNTAAVDPNAPLAQQIVAYAKTFVGFPYVYATAGPDSFDCSGLTSYVYKHFGYSLNRSSKDQAKNGTPVNKSDLQPGDLVFFSRDGSVITHVGLYAGDGKFVHASTPAVGVVIGDLNTSYYIQHYVTARRIL